MTDETSDSPWAQIPPDWVPLRDVPRFIEHRFSAPPRETVPELVQAVRTGQLPHRVAAGVSNIRWGLPPGLECKSGNASSSARLTVANWEQAGMDWSAGTVAGRADAASKSQRWAVELPWAFVVSWFPGTSAYVRTIRMRLSIPAPAPVPSSAASLPPQPEGGATPPRNTGGRTVQHDWDRFWSEVALYAHDNGLEAAGSVDKDRKALHAHMMRWCEANMNTTPDESAIRRKLQTLFERLAAQKRAARN